ncbi:MAG: citrate synthase/methylcitrate synthase [Chloroflexota bacterium]
MNTTSPYTSGLENVIAAQTSLSRVNGQLGELVIAGYSAEEIAQKASFEEMIYLLWHGKRPTVDTLGAFSAELRQKSALPEETISLLKTAVSQKINPMAALRMAAGTVDLDQSSTDRIKLGQLLVARFSTIVATYWRLLNGTDLIAPNSDLNHAANFLFMLSGEVPSSTKSRALETYFNTVVDHGLNASTFAARVIIATQSDLVSAVTGAVGALKGPLHGGAPGPALQLVFDIGTAENAEPFLRQKLDHNERLMGFGHRVYKVRDPRAEILGQAAKILYENDGDMALYQLAQHVERTAVSLLNEYKPGRNLQTNVEFYTALLLHGLGLHSDLFPAIFAMSRVAGWLAHCFEQQDNGRLIRPKAAYVGAEGLVWN